MDIGINVHLGESFAVDIANRSPLTGNELEYSRISITREPHAYNGVSIFTDAAGLAKIRDAINEHLGDVAAKASRNPLFDELIAILDGDEFPEINPRNYTHDEAERLNRWACDLVRDVDKVLCRVKPPLPRFTKEESKEAAAMETINMAALASVEWEKLG